MTTTAVPRDITAAELHAQQDALRTALSRYEVIKTNCGHCKHFEMGTCEMHGDVPITFQKSVDECDDWRYDGVPF
jgi:hypothetical protein